MCYGWEVLAEDGVEVHTIPGGHLNMVKESNVQVLAEKIKSSIDSTSKKSNHINWV
jgi:thioesterase domain-containing protein